MVLAGCLDIDSSRKGARFVRFCDAFNIPIVTFVDVPGFLPGTAQEYGAIINGAKLLSRLRRGDSAQVTVITRKAYFTAALTTSWPPSICAATSTMPGRRRDRGDGGKGVVEIIFRSDLGDAAAITKRTEEYRQKFANPFVAANRGFIDDDHAARHGAGSAGRSRCSRTRSSRTLAQARQHPAVGRDFHRSSTRGFLPDRTRMRHGVAAGENDGHRDPLPEEGA